MVAFTWFAMLLVEAARFYEEYNLGNNYEEYNLGDAEYDQEESYEDATLGDSYEDAELGEGMEDAELGEGMEDAELEEGMEEADYNLGEVFQQANLRSERLGNPTKEKGRKRDAIKAAGTSVKNGGMKLIKGLHKGAKKGLHIMQKGGSKFAEKARQMTSKSKGSSEKSNALETTDREPEKDKPASPDSVNIQTEAGKFQDCLRVNVRAKHHDAANAERMLILGVPSLDTEGKMHRFRCAHKDNGHPGANEWTTCTDTSHNGQVQHTGCQTHEYDTETMSLMKSSSQSTVKRSQAKSQHLGSPRSRSQSAESRAQHSDRAQSKARRQRSRQLSSEYKYY